MNQDIFTEAMTIEDFIKTIITREDFKSILNEIIKLSYERKIWKSRYSCSSFVLNCEHRLFGGKGK